MDPVHLELVAAARGCWEAARQATDAALADDAPATADLVGLLARKRAADAEFERLIGLTIAMADARQ